MLELFLWVKGCCHLPYFNGHMGYFFDEKSDKSKEACSDLCKLKINPYQE